MLNDISWRLGLDGRDIDESDRVHYYSEDNYEDCQSRVTSEISSLMDKAGQTLSLTTEDGTVVVKGCTYLLKATTSPLKCSTCTETASAARFCTWKRVRRTLRTPTDLKVFKLLT